jgi:hypothetical protein
MAVGGFISTIGKNTMLNRTYKAVPDYTAITEFKVGIGTTTPTVADTDIETQVPLSGTESVDACDATTGWTASASDAVATTTNYYKEGTAALTLSKAATGVVTCDMDKTTTSRDFTSKTLWTFVYISSTLYALLEASGTAVEIRFGSDNANYYNKTYTKANLAAGWNYLHYTSATASGTTGSPVIGSCDYTYISYVTAAIGSTTSADDFVVDDFKVASQDDYEKIFVTGYPTFNETDKTVTVRAFLNTLEANGYPVTEIVTQNTDGTPRLMGHDVINEQSKSNLDEFAFVIVDEMV